MFANLHYMGVSTDGAPYSFMTEPAKSWPVEGLQLYFFSYRMPRLYALSHWLNYLAQHPLAWLVPSEDAWEIDLEKLRINFDNNEKVPRSITSGRWPAWFIGRIILVPEWEHVDEGHGHHRFSFILTEWQVTKSKLPPIAGAGATIIHGDQIHMRDVHGNVGNIGSHSAPVISIVKHNSNPQAEDLKGLAEELARLRLELKRCAETVDHDRAIVAVGEAEEAARKNDTSIVTEKLKVAGAWALDIASKIGVNVAAEALKKTIGLS